jgi:hypothetical protein
MATIQLPRDFKEFLKLLNEKNVEYLLISGHAVASYGHIRATNDINFWIATSPDNAKKVAEAINEFGFGLVEAETFTNPSQIIPMGIPPMLIEVTTFIDGVNFADCYAERVATTIDSTPVNIISLERLRQNKAASGRLKDLADLEHLPKQE